MSLLSTSSIPFSLNNAHCAHGIYTLYKQKLLPLTFRSTVYIICMWIWMCHIGICANFLCESIACNIPRIIKCNFRKIKFVNHKLLNTLMRLLARSLSMALAWVMNLCAHWLIMCWSVHWTLIYFMHSYIQIAFGKLENMLLEMQNHHQSQMTRIIDKSIFVLSHSLSTMCVCIHHVFWKRLIIFRFEKELTEMAVEKNWTYHDCIF